MPPHRDPASGNADPEASTAAPIAPLTPTHVGAGPRIDVLDGWRALSILCVLAGHWLPLGPHHWGLNEATAAAGMALFFTLSGFLIVRVLIEDPRVVPFLIRRGFRIMPLAWAVILVLALANHVDIATLAANLSFVANLPPSRLMHGGETLWSLCVEVQFYVGIAIVVALAGRRGLLILPLGAVAVTIARIVTHQTISIVTWHRVDEILAGASLALLVHYGRADRHLARLPAWMPVVLFALLVAAGTQSAGGLAYCRPYLAAGAVGASLFAIPGSMRVLLGSRPARYVAQISYAVYVLHGMFGVTWLGSGDVVAKYAKRPLLIIVTFALAHVSTFRFEARWIGIGKRLARRWPT